MEDLSFSSRLDHEPATLFDDPAEARTETRVRSASNPAPAYRAVSLLDDLSAYAAVFECSAGCKTVDV